MKIFDANSTYVLYQYKYSNGENMTGCTQHCGNPDQVINDEIQTSHAFWHKALKPKKAKPTLLILKVLSKEEVEQTIEG